MKRSKGVANFDEKERYAALIKAFEEKKLDGVAVTLKEVSFIKLFCDGYYMKRLPPRPVGAIEADAEPAGADESGYQNQCVGRGAN